MIVVTGAAGFIGSCLISRLNADFFNYIVAVDDFSVIGKTPNLENKKIKHKIERSQFIQWLDNNYKHVECIFHIGARTDTTEFDRTIFDELNVNYSKKIWNAGVQYQIPIIYASSAATYGLGELGYDDDESKISQLKPLNPYGDSKNEFDIWALEQKDKPFFWAGLKFFNVYGPNEYHKNRMASVVFHTFNQIQETGKSRLFRSHNPKFSDGGQLRDFIYVKDLLEVCMFLLNYRKNSGIYNLGTGKARTFLDLAQNVFKNTGKTENIEFIDTPIDIRDKYQYFTQANMSKLINIGYNKGFHSLEDGIEDYVKNYLIGKKYY
ncbi:MAG: ADP-glyceromanno-heptose 6-epimerase [Bacteroidetes bacterium]|nr:MAG: ADP-glyceromanno-heptose 6-epimerase [Bacteroidota bacterium]